LPFWLNNPFSPLGDLGVNFVTAMLDGSVQTRSSAISMDLLKALITRNGGEDNNNPPPIVNVPGFFVYQTAGNTSVNEFGTDSFAVVLDKAPTSDVVISLAVSDTAVATLDKKTLTFTPSNWNVPQYIGFRGVDNHVVNSDRNVQVFAGVIDEMSDDSYDSVSSQAFFATVRDDDFRLGDLDGNGIVQQGDYNAWTTSFAKPGTGYTADGNRDGNVDAADYVMWRKLMPPSVPEMPGDYDNNGSVQYADHGVWMGGFSESGAGLAADGNRDGSVDAADYVLWRKLMSEGGSGGVAAEVSSSLVTAILDDVSVAAAVETVAKDAALDWLAMNSLFTTDARKSGAIGSPVSFCSTLPTFAVSDALLLVLESTEHRLEQPYAFEFDGGGRDAVDAEADETQDEFFADLVEPSEW
jgi:hypothetical protein